MSSSPVASASLVLKRRICPTPLLPGLKAVSVAHICPGVLRSYDDNIDTNSPLNPTETELPYIVVPTEQ